MNKLICIAALGLFFSGKPCGAQSTLPTTPLPTEEKTTSEEEAKRKSPVPLWLQELSNLPVEQRQLYTSSFAKAKAAYAAAKYAECELHLNSCEMIYQGNPNVWSLRASLYIAQQRFDEAEALTQKAIKEQPGDPITAYNLSSISLSKGDYVRCIEQTSALMEKIRFNEGMPLLHSLKFRLLLANLMLGRLDEAKKLVADVTPLDDSPLYYYSQAAFAIYRGDGAAAAKDIATAERIYHSEKYLPSYKQSLSSSRLQDKYLPKQSL